MNNETHVEVLQKVMKDNNGYLTAKMVTSLGFSREYLKIMQNKNLIKKVGVGVYIDSNLEDDTYYTNCLIYSNIIYSHLSSLFLFNVIDSCQEEITMKKFYNVKKNKDNIYHYVGEEIFNLGMIYIRTKKGNLVRTYNLERTICDLIKNKNKYEESYLSELILKIFNEKEIDRELLIEYSLKIGNTKKVIKYLNDLNI